LNFSLHTFDDDIIINVMEEDVTESELVGQSELKVW
jgi:hypothetical protein